MDAKAIVDKILEDSRSAASSMLVDAQKKASALKADLEARLEKQKSSVLLRANTDGDLMRERMLRMAELENKKEVLSSKRIVMDKVFENALSKFKTEQKEKLYPFFLSMVKEYAQGDENFLLGKENNAWFTQDFLNEANEQLKALSKKGALTLSNESIDGVGFALEKSGTLINCTVDALIEQERMNLETDVAKILFG